MLKNLFITFMSPSLISKLPMSVVIAGCMLTNYPDSSIAASMTSKSKFQVFIHPPQFFHFDFSPSFMSWDPEKLIAFLDLSHCVLTHICKCSFWYVSHSPRRYIYFFLKLRRAFDFKCRAAPGPKKEKSGPINIGFWPRVQGFLWIL